MADAPLPQDEAQWASFARDHQVDPAATLHGSVQKSGSKISNSQFALLRVLWNPGNEKRSPLELERLCNDGLIQKRHLDAADKFLRDLAGWNAYRSSLRDESSRNHVTSAGNVAVDLGIFSLVRYYQHLSTETAEYPEEENPPMMDKIAVSSRRSDGDSEGRPVTPTPTDMDQLGDKFDHVALRTPSSGPPSTMSSEYPLVAGSQKMLRAVEDEQIVNTSLILFLNALTIHHPGVEGHWSLYRQPFTVLDAKKQKVYAAQVDGVFRLRKGAEDARVIVEVKPFARLKSLPVYIKIQMQESAQMAAWIATQPTLAPPEGTKRNKGDKYRYGHSKHDVPVCSLQIQN